MLCHYSGFTLAWKILKFEQFFKDRNWCLQLWYPYYRLREEGYETFTIGPEQGKTYNSKHGYPCKAEVGIDDVNHEVEHAIHHHSFCDTVVLSRFWNISKKWHVFVWKYHNLTIWIKSNLKGIHYYQTIKCILKVINQLYYSMLLFFFNIIIDFKTKSLFIPYILLKNYFQNFDYPHIKW